MKITCSLFLCCALFLLSGCQSAYYATMEKFGLEKRDILVDRVEDAREAQQDAKQQFESALDQFIAVTNYDGGDLEKQYRKLKSEFEDSEERAREVSSRIESVEQVASDLFREWKAELDQYSSRDLRRSSERQLKETQEWYGKLIKTMKVAEKRMTPVLDAFRDRVLFLKHNLNARAISSLRSERDRIRTDIKELVRDMNTSISEADSFIRKMK